MVSLLESFQRQPPGSARGCRQHYEVLEGRTSAGRTSATAAHALREAPLWIVGMQRLQGEISAQQAEL